MKVHLSDQKYNLLIPIKYNFNKPVSGLGSCIFIHLTDDYKPTEGCIVLKKKDFLIMLKIINKKTKIKIIEFLLPKILDPILKYVELFSTAFK